MNMYLIFLISITITMLVFLGVSVYLSFRRGLDRYAIGSLLVGTFSGALIRPEVLLPAFTILLAGGAIGAVLHEYCHYYSSLIWMEREDVHIEFRPFSVIYDSPNDAPPNGIRFIAISPYLAMGILLTYYVVAFGTPFSSLLESRHFVPKWLITGIIIGLGIGMSPSDLLATIRPRTFQKWASGTDELNNHEAWELLIHRSN